MPRSQSNRFVLPRRFSAASASPRLFPAGEKRQRAAADQDAPRGTATIEKRTASWTAPVLWSFAGRVTISSVAPRPTRRRLPALVAQVLQKIFDECVHCFVGLTVNSTNRLLCKTSLRFSDLTSS